MEYTTLNNGVKCPVVGIGSLKKNKPAVSICRANRKPGGKQA